MAIDFQEVSARIQALGDMAVQRQREIKALRSLAFDLLEKHASSTDFLIERIQRITRLYDPNLRCAAPAGELNRPIEPLNSRVPLPEMPAQVTLLAADGSQINPNRHEQVNYCLINVGAIQVRLSEPDPPLVRIKSELLFDEALYTEGGILTEAQVALMRDLREREWLAEIASQAEPPVITFTDGPMELWGSTDAQTRTAFEKSLDEYRKVLRNLSQIGATTAGYVDKPSANLVTRLLEIASCAEQDLRLIRDRHPLNRVSDRHIFQTLLQPGERSAVFSIQSSNSGQYLDDLAIHFFYINVGRAGRPWLARVEIPAWVAKDPSALESLHAVLFQQCQILGSRPFPYLIHRAHEAAVVSLEEKTQVTQMIIAEMYRRGVEVDDPSSKQYAKDLPLRTRYER